MPFKFLSSAPFPLFAKTSGDSEVIAPSQSWDFESSQNQETKNLGNHGLAKSQLAEKQGWDSLGCNSSLKSEFIQE